MSKNIHLKSSDKPLIMEKELQDSLKLVAEFMGDEDGLIVIGMYDQSWRWQIPVWAKLVNMHINLPQQIISPEESIKYYQAIDDDNPRAGFDIIVSIIKRIKQ